MVSKRVYVVGPVPANQTNKKNYVIMDTWLLLPFLYFLTVFPGLCTSSFLCILESARFFLLSLFLLNTPFNAQLIYRPWLEYMNEHLRWTIKKEYLWREWDQKWKQCKCYICFSSYSTHSCFHVVFWTKVMWNRHLHKSY